MDSYKNRFFTKCGAMVKKTFIAIILARGGSKGVKNKNMVKIKNKPLIYWSIKACLNSKKIKSVWVSSDNDEILNYSKKCGADTIKRPKKYSSDESSSESAWLHAVKLLDDENLTYSEIIGLQATSPLRNKSDLDNACKFYTKYKYDSLFTALKISDHFIWKKKGKKLLSNYNFKKRPRRQKIEDKFLENGSFYIFNKKKFLEFKNRLFGKIGIYLMSKINSFQIDDYEDIQLLKKLAGER